MELKIAGLTNDSIVDGPGLRLTVFAQGCPHDCNGCHNKGTHDFVGGSYMSVSEIIEKAKKNPLLSGITLSGGEPFMQADAMLALAKGAHEIDLNVIIYTGYTWEELMANESFKALAYEADYVIDGRFEIDKKTLNMPFIGSSNQRIIDVKKTKESGEIIIAEF